MVYHPMAIESWGLHKLENDEDGKTYTTGKHFFETGRETKKRGKRKDFIGSCFPNSSQYKKLGNMGNSYDWS